MIDKTSKNEALTTLAVQASMGAILIAENIDDQVRVAVLIAGLALGSAVEVKANHTAISKEECIADLVQIVIAMIKEDCAIDASETAHQLLDLIHTGKAHIQ